MEARITEEVMDSLFKKILAEQITIAISELQALDAIMVEEDFELGEPEQYTPYQRRFVSMIISRLYGTPIEDALDTKVEIVD